MNSQYLHFNTLLKFLSLQNLLCLQVKFNEEDGFDDGGVSMEYFHLLAKELQKAEPQILEVNEHGVAWFSKNVRIHYFGVGIKGAVCRIEWHLAERTWQGIKYTFWCC